MRENLRRTAGIALLAALLLPGCAEFGIRDDFETTQQRYMRLVRWNEFAKASQLVDPELRTDYLRAAHELEDVRFSDYEVAWLERAEDGKTATAQVRYRAYSAAALIELPALDETQEWYRDPETGNWLVRPDLAALSAGPPQTPH